ncbi:MAG: hypothetical protein ABWY58_00790 [Aeromicrobium sp.]
MSGPRPPCRDARLGRQGRVDPGGARRLLGWGLAAALAFAAAPASTAATWSDTDVSAGSFTALTVPRPAFSACTVSPGVFGAFGSFTITWRPPPGYGVADAVYAVDSRAAFDSPTPVLPITTGPDANGDYRSTFVAGLLAFLGTRVYLGIQIKDTSGWRSSYRVARGDIAVLAINSGCVLL